MDLPRVLLRPRRARPFYGRHPWVFAGAVERVEGEPRDGDVVDLVSHAGHFVARGLFNSRSKIRVRLYSWAPDVPLDAAFFRDRLAAAVRLRESILKLNGPGRGVATFPGERRGARPPVGPLPGGSRPTTRPPGRACRLVFSEGDGLSGCTVDRYDRWLVLQFTALALAQRRDLIADLLEEMIQPEGIYLRTERGVGQLEGLELQDGLFRGWVPAEPVPIEENGLRFLVHLTEGQKTGFYLDQRDNRRAVASLSEGRRVLDAFCYSGGFGLHAARAGAREVVGVDASEPALALARENARLNSLERVSFVREDIFPFLDRLDQAGERFGMVILDPPKFARKRDAVDEALRGYRRLQTLGLRLLEPDGILVTCCCSGLITMPMLEDLLSQIAAEVRRDVQILERRGQAPDHPIAAACPETSYLKCLISRVL